MYIVSAYNSVSSETTQKAASRNTSSACLSIKSVLSINPYPIGYFYVMIIANVPVVATTLLSPVNDLYAMIILD